MTKKLTVITILGTLAFGMNAYAIGGKKTGKAAQIANANNSTANIASRLSGINSSVDADALTKSIDSGLISENDVNKLTDISRDGDSTAKAAVESVLKAVEAQQSYKSNKTNSVVSEKEANVDGVVKRSIELLQGNSSKDLNIAKLEKIALSAGSFFAARGSDQKYSELDATIRDGAEGLEGDADAVKAFKDCD